MCTLIVLYKLFKDAPIMALHNRYEREGTVEYPPRVSKRGYRVYSPIDVASEGTWVGFNEEGLCVALTDQHSDGVGIVRRSRGRLALDLLGKFSEAGEATKYLEEEIRKGYQKGNFAILDKDQGFHVIYDIDVTTRKLTGGAHVITNITPIPGVALPPKIREILERADVRRGRALELVQGIDTNDLDGGVRALQRIASDHGREEGRRSICYHDETGEWRMTSSTVVAVGRSAEESRILYCNGTPCENEFLDYSHLLKIGGVEVLKKDAKLAGRRVALCLTGSVAAIEAPKLARELRRHGAEVVCYMTDYGVKYGVSPEVMEWATGNGVIRELGGMAEHLYDYDVVLVYPATFNTIGKMANGVADNAVTTLCAATDKDRVIIAPAMNMRLYNSPVLGENLSKLEGLGATILVPRFSEGIAKIPRKDVVVDHVIRKLSMSRLGGRKALILAGPTRYDLDPVRYISNKSSGRLGYWLAREGFQRGCGVKVIYGPGRMALPEHIPVVKAYTTEDMLRASLRELSGDNYDIALFSAAILDYRPRKRMGSKVRSGQEWTVELAPTPKVIERAIEKHPDLFVVAFKLEHGAPKEELIEEGYKRLMELGAGLMVANDLTEIRGERHKAYIINRKKEVQVVDETKAVLAKSIFDAIEKSF